MKVWLPVHTLSRFARAISMRSALIGLTTFALITPLTSNCFGQFTVSNSATPDQGQSILVREGEQLDSAEPHQSGATPKPYSARQQTADKTADKSAAQAIGGGGFISSNSLRDASAGNQHATNFSARQAPAFSARQLPKSRSEQDITPLPTQRRTDARQQAQSNDDVIVDRSVAPASFAAPVQNFQNQSRRSMQSLQPRQNAGQAGQANLGQANRNDSRRNQAAQSAPHRQGNRSAKKTSASAKVLISRFGFKAPQDNSENLVPLRLADVLNQGQMRANRGQLIDQYWETFDHWAQSVSAKQHRDWVNGLRVSKSTDQSTVGVAKSNAENEVTSNRIQLGKSQAKLKSILGTRASIVPADLPTVTMVKTNFQAFKERGLIPARMEGIDQTLKDLHDLVLSRADTVLLAERTAEQVEGYYKSNRATIEQLLGAGRAWRSAEADFVDSTIQYNKAYADYALALPYGRAPVEQVVAMLVVPAKVSPTPAAPTYADPSAGRNTQQAQRSPTPSRPVSSGRSIPQRPAGSPQGGLDSRVRAASNGFGRSSVQQPRTSRPMPDFSESSNDSAAAASFATPKTPEFRPRPVASPQPDVVAPQRGNPTARREARSPSASFSGGSASPSATPSARQSATPATSGLGFEGSNASKPAAQPARGFSDVSAGRPSPSFSSPVNNKAKGPSVDPFSSRPAVTKPIVKPPVKPSASFGGSGAGIKAADATARDGFSSGFRN